MKKKAYQKDIQGHEL